MSAAAFSVYYYLRSKSSDHLLHRNLRVGHTMMTMKNSVQLMMASYYNNIFHHRLVFLVALTVLLKKFFPQAILTSIINALLSLSFTDLVLILNLLVTYFWHSVSNWFLTSSHDEIKYIKPKPCRDGSTKLQEWSQKPYNIKLLTFWIWDFLKKFA
jgi:hypothetical protein